MTYISQPSSAPARGYRFCPQAWLLTATLVALVSFRLHEVLPGLGVIKPVFLVTWGGGAFLLANTNVQALNAACRLKMVRLFTWFFGWAAVTVPFALWPGLAFSTLRSVPYAAALLVFPALCTPKVRELDRVQAGFVIAGTVLAVAGLVWGRDQMEDRLAVSGTYDANDVAGVLAATLPLALGMAARSTKLRVPMFVAAAALVMAIVGTASRGGLIAVVVGLLVWIGGLAGTRRLLYGVVLAIAAVVSWSTAPPVFRERMATIVSLEEDYNTTDYTGRQQIWERGIGYLTANPVAGVGINNFTQAEGMQLDKLGVPGKWSAAHNMYVQVFAELGFVGGGIFLTLLSVAFRSAAKVWRSASPNPGLHRPELLACLAAFSVAGVFLSAAYSFALYGFLGLIVIASRVQATEVGGAVRAMRLPFSPPARLRGGGWGSRVAGGGRPY